MMRKLGKILIWILLVAWFFIMLSFVSARSGEELCTRIHIHISDSASCRLVTRDEVRIMLDRSSYQLQGYPLSGINTREIELELEKSPYVQNAEVSKDMSGKLDVRIDQRTPLVRMLPEKGDGYYLDLEGRILPLSGHYTPLILVVSGNLPAEWKSGESGEEGKKHDELEKLFLFCSHLNAHELWKNQVVQVYRDKKGEYELVPMVGAHRILLGSLEEWEQKLEHLELLYTEGLSRYGWNTYSMINLKYTNQVICTKR